jgi:hypothetical protein
MHCFLQVRVSLTHRNKLGWLLIIVFLAVMPWTGTTSGAEGESPLTLKIVDGSGQPIACQIQRISQTGTIESVGHTDAENPVATIADGCRPGCRLLFVPDAGSVYYRDYAFCPYKKATFTVTPITNNETQQFAKHLAGSTATVAFAASEIADRAPTKSIRKAYQITSYLEAAKFLNVSAATTYDPNQKAMVPSDELYEELKEFQRSNGIKATGNLDYSTLRSATGLTTEQLIRSDVESPKG